MAVPEATSVCYSLPTSVASFPRLMASPKVIAMSIALLALTQIPSAQAVEPVTTSIIVYNTALGAALLGPAGLLVAGGLFIGLVLYQTVDREPLPGTSNICRELSIDPNKVDSREYCTSQIV